MAASFPWVQSPGGKLISIRTPPEQSANTRARGTFTTDLPNFVLASAHKKPAAPDMAFASEMFSLANDKWIILTDGTWPNAYFFGDSGRARRNRGVFGMSLEKYLRRISGENKHAFL